MDKKALHRNEQTYENEFEDEIIYNQQNKKDRKINSMAISKNNSILSLQDSSRQNKNSKYNDIY